MFKKGELIYGYEIVEPMGQVALSEYKARGPDGSFVTLKFPSLAMVGDPATYERFLRESKIGQTIGSPGNPPHNFGF